MIPLFCRMPFADNGRSLSSPSPLARIPGVGVTDQVHPRGVPPAVGVERSDQLGVVAVGEGVHRLPAREPADLVHLETGDEVPFDRPHRPVADQLVLATGHVVDHPRRAGDPAVETGLLPHLAQGGLMGLLARDGLSLGGGSNRHGRAGG